MNIAKALKQKNRLVGEINRCWTTIKGRNTLSFETDLDDKDALKAIGLRNDELDTVFADLDKNQSELISLKSRIQEASLPIVPKLVRLAEAKSQIKQWESLNVSPLLKSSKASRYNIEEKTVNVSNYVEYSAVEATLKDLRDLVNTLQDEIDDFNGRTTV